MTSSNSAADLFPQATRLHRSAVERLLGIHYRRVCRIAHGLCGQEAAGRATVKVVMYQSLRALPAWRGEADAANWFLHHTVLKSREFAPAAIGQDCLIDRVTNPSPDYIAFVRAFRHLPVQQREAFLLFRAEQLEPRQAAIAMDCSTAAAANHLIAANKALSAMARETFDAHAATLGRVYASLTPPDELMVGDISVISRRLSRRRLGRIVRRLFAAAIAAVIACMIWRLSRMIVV